MHANASDSPDLHQREVIEVIGGCKCDAREQQGHSQYYAPRFSLNSP